MSLHDIPAPIHMHYNLCAKTGTCIAFLFCPNTRAHTGVDAYIGTCAMHTSTLAFKSYA